MPSETAKRQALKLSRHGVNVIKVDSDHSVSALDSTERRPRGSRIRRRSFQEGSSIYDIEYPRLPGSASMTLRILGRPRNLSWKLWAGLQSVQVRNTLDIRSTTQSPPKEPVYTLMSLPVEIRAQIFKWVLQPARDPGDRCHYYSQLGTKYVIQDLGHARLGGERRRDMDNMRLLRAKPGHIRNFLGVSFQFACEIQTVLAIHFSYLVIYDYLQANLINGYPISIANMRHLVLHAGNVWPMPAQELVEYRKLFAAMSNLTSLVLRFQYEFKIYEYDRPEYTASQEGSKAREQLLVQLVTSQPRLGVFALMFGRDIRYERESETVQPASHPHTAISIYQRIASILQMSGWSCSVDEELPSGSVRCRPNFQDKVLYMNRFECVRTPETSQEPICIALKNVQRTMRTIRDNDLLIQTRPEQPCPYVL
ncbi:MAG: hypothetical protein M1820_001396 [Bogoriella megaspora]|nr:MAG: hypothetical protein M1820_001396 [Bogoriella megaspora]